MHRLPVYKARVTDLNIVAQRVKLHHNVAFPQKNQNFSERIHIPPHIHISTPSASRPSCEMQSSLRACADPLRRFDGGRHRDPRSRIRVVINNAGRLAGIQKAPIKVTHLATECLEVCVNGVLTDASKYITILYWLVTREHTVI